MVRRFIRRGPLFGPESPRSSAAPTVALSGSQPDFSRTWKKHLCVIWIAQFMSAIGFSFGLPFISYLMQEDMGITDEKQLAYWIAAFSAACPLTMMFFSPVWGALGDRYGRKKMLLRSYVGGAVAIGLISIAQDPVTLVILRVVQGAFCGTMSASQTLLSTQTPREHTGFALGALNSAMFSGTIAGSFAGGYVAEYAGYRPAFLISAVCMALAFVAVYFFFREYPHARNTPPGPNGLRGVVRALRPETAQIAYLLPILVIMGLVMFSRSFDNSFVPIFVQKLHGDIRGASRITGALSGLCGLAGVVSGFLLGYLADHYPPGRLAVISSVLTAAFMFSISFVWGLAALFVLRFAMIFMGSGIEPAMQIWLAKKTDERSRGQMFGWASAMRCLGLG
ncbi:MAG: MFS transporter, partial [Lentisphaeria bacterium]|nr:MFS transporter [Lentisphaeria bacterium]